MKPISEITEALSLEELQTEKNSRDAEVVRLREEMKTIHSLMEPKWSEQQRLAAGPVNLRQMLGGNHGK